MDIRVNVKHMGRRRKSVEPVVCRLFTAPSTVRELILAVVEAGVRDYNDKLKDGDLQEVLRCLTRQEIEDKAETGKVAFGGGFKGGL